jgi:hypothetical protein
VVTPAEICSRNVASTPRSCSAASACGSNAGGGASSLRRDVGRPDGVRCADVGRSTTLRVARAHSGCVLLPQVSTVSGCSVPCDSASAVSCCHVVDARMAEPAQGLDALKSGSAATAAGRIDGSHRCLYRMVKGTAEWGRCLRSVALAADLVACAVCGRAVHARSFWAWPGLEETPASARHHSGRVHGSVFACPPYQQVSYIRRGCVL